MAHSSKEEEHEIISEWPDGRKEAKEHFLFRRSLRNSGKLDSDILGRKHSMLEVPEAGGPFEELKV